MKKLDLLLRITAEDLGISYRHLLNCAEELADIEGISLYEAIEQICGGY